ncbi:hypothetical protein KYY02_19560 [Streptomyces pimonensis]|uniref:Uncharacterized protein n=1 Tax=Streptomyces pimonensis TaxID=2860288 RepID=A0ABV4J5A9_9ACTN
MATSSSIQITGHGFAELPVAIDLQSTASNTWVNTGCQVALPVAGTYHLDAVVRANLSVPDGSNVWIGARLLDVTANVTVPDSEMLIYQIAHSVAPTTTAVTIAGNQSAPILVPYTVPGTRLVRLQVRRVVGVGNSTVARILSDGNSRTTLRYERVA